MKTKRRKFNATFKARVAIEALKERETLSELSRKYELHPNIISKWKKEFLDKADQVFESKKSESDPEVDIEKLYAKIGKLEIERDFLKKNLKKIGL